MSVTDPLSHSTSFAHDSQGNLTTTTDALGSSVALTNGAGASQTTYTYEPFGTTMQAGTASTNPFQFTGRENDETGLAYYRARYYSPRMGRFVSEDPIGIVGGFNFYSYVRSNPLTNWDPAGVVCHWVYQAER